MSRDECKQPRKISHSQGKSGEMSSNSDDSKPLMEDKVNKGGDSWRRSRSPSWSGNSGTPDESRIKHIECNSDDEKQLENGLDGSSKSVSESDWKQCYTRCKTPPNISDEFEHCSSKSNEEDRSKSPENKRSISKDSDRSKSRDRDEKSGSKDREKAIKRKTRDSKDKKSSRHKDSRRSRSRSKQRFRSHRRSRSQSKRRSHSRSHRRSRSRSHTRRSRSHSRRSRSRSSTPPDGARLHVAELDVDIRKRDLERVFDKYGTLREIWMARKPPCFAFVVYKHQKDAEKAIKETDGMTIGRCRIKVTQARPRVRGGRFRGYDPNLRCYQCGELGHFSRNCTDTKFGYKRPPTPPGSYHRR